MIFYLAVLMSDLFHYISPTASVSVVGWLYIALRRIGNCSGIRDDIMFINLKD